LKTKSPFGCCNSWAYNVAPLVKFKNASGLVEERIIDPSLFPDALVALATWRAGCNNTTCSSTGVVTRFANASSDIYYRSPTGKTLTYDYNYINTNCVLTKYRNLTGCSPSPSPSTSSCGR